jgi:outer membrane murein-binding lipoprotein Lpp
MDKNALLVAALANVPTVITVLIGILINNARISDLNSRVTETNSRLMNFENKMDTRFDMLLGKVVEIDNRLTRMEAQRH